MSARAVCNHPLTQQISSVSATTLMINSSVCLTLGERHTPLRNNHMPREVAVSSSPFLALSRWALSTKCTLLVRLQNILTRKVAGQLAVRFTIACPPCTSPHPLSLMTRTTTFVGIQSLVYVVTPHWQAHRKLRFLAGVRWISCATKAIIRQHFRCHHWPRDLQHLCPQGATGTTALSHDRQQTAMHLFSRMVNNGRSSLTSTHCFLSSARHRVISMAPLPCRRLPEPSKPLAPRHAVVALREHRQIASQGNSARALA